MTNPVDESSQPSNSDSLSVGCNLKSLMLSSTNYTVWSMRMKVILQVNDVWETIDPGLSDKKKNNVATALIFQSIPEALILQVGEQGTSKKLWDAIKARYLGADRVREARLQTLMAEFERLKMTEGESIDEFAGKISGLVSQSASLGTIIEESKVVKKFLTGLPSGKYIHIVASLEQVLDLNSTSFEDIVGRLKTYEERVTKELGETEQGRLMYVSNPKPNQGTFGQETSYGHNGAANFGNQNRGGGGFRGRGRFNAQTREKGSGEANEKNKKDLSRVRCWRCDEYGHYVNKCPSRPPRDQEANLNETQEADGLFMHEVVFLNEEKIFPRILDAHEKDESEWYLDNGASNHMTGNKSLFSNLDETVKGKVKFGDGSQVDIVGKGTITFMGRSKERRIIKDIYYIPSLKHNIISLGQETENGSEVNMKANRLVWKDSHGVVIAEVTRSMNRLYRTAMEVYVPKCLRVEKEDVTETWSSRLGHVSQGVMKVYEETKCWEWTENDRRREEPGTFTIIRNRALGGTGPELVQQVAAEPENIHGLDEEGEIAANDGSENEEGDHETENDKVIPSQTQQTEAKIVTRAGRRVTKTKRFEDYVLMAEIEGDKLLFTVNGEQENYAEAAKIKEWIDAMIAELDSIVKNKTWVLAEQPLARNKLQEMRSLIGVQEIDKPKIHVGIKGENVG